MKDASFDKPEKKTEFISIRVTPDVKEKLDCIASNSERSISWVVGNMIEFYLMEYYLEE